MRGAAQLPPEKELVAVIDDNPFIREALQDLLSSLGYRVESYESSETFLECAAVCRAMCLLLDVELGGSSGIDLARELLKRGLDFQIVFMTGNHDRAVQRQAREVGYVAYLRKPFAVELLADVLLAVSKQAD